jgi:hypothetical protein
MHSRTRAWLVRKVQLAADNYPIPILEVFC